MDLESRVQYLETERKLDNVEKVCRSYRMAGILEGLAIACLIYGLVVYLRGGNS